MRPGSGARDELVHALPLRRTTRSAQGLAALRNEFGGHPVKAE